MKLEGRRSSRNLPKSLSSGTVISAPANGDCFFHLVSLGIKNIQDKINDVTGPSGHSPKRRKMDSYVLVDDSDLNTDVPLKISNYTTVKSLRNLVADKYLEETFKLLIVAGQIPCTSRTIPSFEEFKNKLRNERAFADEHCIGIISSQLDIAFLILDDNIGGKPTCYWNAGESILAKDESQKKNTQPKYFMTLRLGRQHYSGIQFDNKILHDSNQLHPQISAFWETEIKNMSLKILASE